MTDLTMGQRISECRKKQGLSQEALGEKVGVSRQAISKWEADGAVPEIDKLIALSRLFETSVGWLLGVEEEKEPSQTEQVSEELLYKLEEIVKRYQQKPETTEKKFPWIISILLFAVAAAIVVLLFWWVFNPKPSDYSGQIAGLESRITSLQSQISSLSSRIGEAEAADSPISHYDFQITPDTEESVAHITITVIPKTWSESLTTTLSVRRKGVQVLYQAVGWDGTGYTAQITLPIDDGYEYWFVTGYPDGTQEQTRLRDNAAENIADTYVLACKVQQGTGRFDLQAGTLTLQNYEVYLQPPYQTVSYDVTLSSAELVLYHIRGGERHIADTYELFGPKDFTGTDGQPEAVSGIECYPNGPFQLPELQDGNGLELWVKAEMSNGISAVQLINSWAYSDGEFISSVPVAE